MVDEFNMKTLSYEQLLARREELQEAKENNEELRYTQEVFLSGRIAEINHLIEVVKT